VVDLPKGIHRVITRGREYYYWHPGRGTTHAGTRTRLPDDPTDPAFWVAVREAQGVTASVVMTFGAVVDLYEVSPQFKQLSDSTKEHYRRYLRIAKAGFSDTPAEAMKPSHIRGVVDGLSDTPGAANNFLGTMRALSAWGLVRDHFAMSLTHGIEPFFTGGGHKPWTDAQIKAAHDHLTGYLRRGVLLELYTGQRGSDAVRLGWTDIEDGGFRLRQRKTGREVWCPIVDELAAEMATWEKRPGPFLRQDSGKPFTGKLFAKHYRDVRSTIPALVGTSLHGLRATAVVRLRRQGLSTAQIQDVVGMSMSMIERYSRFADKKASGKAAIIRIAEHSRNDAL
jgi:integrase